MLSPAIALGLPGAVKGASGYVAADSGDRGRRREQDDDTG